MTEPEKKSHPLTSVSGIAGAIGGWSLSHYCGVSIWIPGLAFLLLALLFAKSPVRPKHFAGAIAATAAHLAWFVVGVALTGQWSAVILDIVMLGLGIVWLWVRPGLPAVFFLGLIQAAALLFNVVALIAQPVGSLSHRALVAHVAFRLLAIILLVVGQVRLRRERASIS